MPLHTPDHDRTKQWHGFAFVQDILDQNSSSVTAILGTSNDMFQIPDTPGLAAVGAGQRRGAGAAGSRRQRQLSAAGQWRRPSFPPAMLDERQREITHYATLSYLRSSGAVDWQVSVFGRYSSLFYTPGHRAATISAICSTTASPRPPTSATTPMAPRTKAPGIWATIPSASACSIKPTIWSAARHRWCCPPRPAARPPRCSIPIRSAPIRPRPARPRHTPENIHRQQHQACLERQRLSPGRMESASAADGKLRRAL